MRRTEDGHPGFARFLSQARTRCDSLQTIKRISSSVSDGPPGELMWYAPVNSLDAYLSGQSSWTIDQGAGVFLSTFASLQACMWADAACVCPNGESHVRDRGQQHVADKRSFGGSSGLLVLPSMTRECVARIFYHSGTNKQTIGERNATCCVLLRTVVHRSCCRQATRGLAHVSRKTR